VRVKYRMKKGSLSLCFFKASKSSKKECDDVMDFRYRSIVCLKVNSKAARVFVWVCDPAKLIFSERKGNHNDCYCRMKPHEGGVYHREETIRTEKLRLLRSSRAANGKEAALGKKDACQE